MATRTIYYLFFLWVSVAIHMVLLVMPWAQEAKKEEKKPIQMEIKSMVDEIKRLLNELAEIPPEPEEPVEEIADEEPPPPEAETEPDVVPPEPEPPEPLAEKFELPELPEEPPIPDPELPEPPEVEIAEPPVEVEDSPEMPEEPVPEEPDPLPDTPVIEPPPDIPGPIVVEQPEDAPVPEPPEPVVERPEPPVPPAPEPTPPPEPRVEPVDTVPEIIERVEETEDYERFEATKDEVKGEKFIHLIIDNLKSWAIVEQITNNYGLLSIGFLREDTPSHYYWLDTRKHEISRSKDFDYLSNNYANLFIEVPKTLPEVRLARQRIAEASKVPIRDVVIGLVLPARTAHYLLWKEYEHCERHGITPSEVRRMKGVFRSSKGKWTFVITEVKFHDGSVERFGG